MARDLRSRLAAMRTDAVKKQALRPHGLLTYIDRRPLLQGADSLSQVGLRRMGWDGTTFNIRDCLFLDTETTGLSGGAGTVAFLVGIGYIEGDELVIEQYMLRDYSDEPELLDRIANHLERMSAVCTFNGKNFDLPLLETRFTLARMRHRWQDLKQLDLLYPARRTWKLRLGNCKLSHLEERILGQPRDHDLPGSEVPARWFEYLKSGDVGLLTDIVDHNRQDIATLVLLLKTLNDIWDAPETLEEPRDLFSVGKALEHQGEVSPARMLYKKSAVPAPAGTLASLVNEPVAALANQRQYLLVRRSGDEDSMLTILEQMLHRRQLPCFTNIELAKFYEHRRKQYTRALNYAEAALRCCDPADTEAIEKRITRLKRKIGGK